MDEIIDRLGNISFSDNFKIKNNGCKYDIGHDSKILSKIYECIVIEELKKSISDLEEIEFIENSVQNKYPDFIIIANGKYYALDIKSTYLKNKRLNGFTLGTYKGYFRDRSSKRNIVLPYKKFEKHYCFCIVYKRKKCSTPVKYTFLREKWELASKSTGSGNTCNIGSIKCVQKILDGETIFENEEEFNKWWMNY